MSSAFRCFWDNGGRLLAAGVEGLSLLVSPCPWPRSANDTKARDGTAGGMELTSATDRKFFVFLRCDK